jgi:host factor-I protein
MTEFNTGFPSIRQIQNFIKNKTPIEISLINTTEKLKGIIQWQDQNCLCLLNNQQQQVLIWFQAIVYLKKQ